MRDSFYFVIENYARYLHILFIAISYSTSFNLLFPSYPILPVACLPVPCLHPTPPHTTPIPTPIHPHPHPHPRLPRPEQLVTPYVPGAPIETMEVSPGNTRLHLGFSHEMHYGHSARMKSGMTRHACHLQCW